MNYTDKDLVELGERFRAEAHVFAAPLVVAITKLVEDAVEARAGLRYMDGQVDRAQALLLRLARDLRDCQEAARVAAGSTDPLPPSTLS